ncbi:MAG: thioredoxin [Bacteroidales bacterium]|nr:thioredoxin [Bacteroidales bacterium]
MAENLTVETFKERVFDYTKDQEWNFKGDKPCIIDFWADWCQPCKMVAPIIEELSEEYKGKVNFYKVDTEAQQELAAVFGIRSIPSLLFCPKSEAPQMALGAIPKETFYKAIKEVLKVEKEEEKEA